MTAALQVLHICSDYAKQKLYPQLVAQLDALGLDQLVYVPVRTAQEVGVNRDDGLRRVTYQYSHILRRRHRILFRSKIRRVVRDLLGHSDPRSFTIAHAHFLYSDGAVALALNRAFDLPYVTAVRNTDVNVFMRLRPDLRWLCWEIIARARAIVFVTPAYREVLRQYLPRRSRESFDAKAHIVPNGLAEFWIANPPAAPRAASDRLKLLYVGDFSRNKNIVTTIRAAAQLDAVHPTTLTLVGSGGDGEADVDALIASGRYPGVDRLGRVENPRALLEIYRSHDIFVMPSIRETFGVAYLEALSQGLPVVFTRGQGIDGYFPEGTVGEAVDPSDVHAVQRAILRLAERLESVRSECVERARAFAWPRVAASYFDLYRAAVRSADEVHGR